MAIHIYLSMKGMSRGTNALFFKNFVPSHERDKPEVITTPRGDDLISGGLYPNLKSLFTGSKYLPLISRLNFHLG